MAAMSLAATTRHALVLRVVLSVLVGVPVTGLALLHLGWASPGGLLFAVPAGYLLYAALKDGIAPCSAARSVWTSQTGRQSLWTGALVICNSLLGGSFVSATGCGGIAMVLHDLHRASGLHTMMNTSCTGISLCA
jgi:hypothetical protein